MCTRLLVALHYLKYQHDLSDEAVVQQWVENPYWQYFSGEQFFQHEMPLIPPALRGGATASAKLARKRCSRKRSRPDCG